ncbi:hypothetical protein GCM10010272_34700 [Streptomyces lateritius]|nr:hypothetical protein GCM10010272_34700 [Streptomyces lateritius]
MLPSTSFWVRTGAAVIALLAAFVAEPAERADTAGEVPAGPAATAVAAGARRAAARATVVMAWMTVRRWDGELNMRSPGQRDVRTGGNAGESRMPPPRACGAVRREGLHDESKNGMRWSRPLHVTSV